MKAAPTRPGRGRTRIHQTVLRRKSAEIGAAIATTMKRTSSELVPGPANLKCSRAKAVRTKQARAAKNIRLRVPAPRLKEIDIAIIENASSASCATRGVGAEIKP